MDVGCACGTILLNKLADYTIEPVFRQFGYVVYYRGNIADLNARIAELDRRLVVVQSQVGVARDNLEQINPAVDPWMKEVESMKQKRDTEFGAQNVSRAWCCHKWCPNLKTRHHLGRRAKKTAARAEELLNRGTFDPISFIPRVNEAGPSSSTSTTPIVATKSKLRASLTKDVMNALADSDTSLVMICGMSGIGKTTLLKEIYNSAEAKSLFGDILKVEVGQEGSNVAELQSEIAELLRLVRLADYINKAKRRELLTERFKSQQRKVLIVLDDVRQSIDFEDVGIPLHGGCCKVLISTWDRHLYGEIKTMKRFSLDLLKEEAAWSLFKEMVGDCIESPELRPVAQTVSRLCDGLPLGISIIGKALNGCGDKKIWNDTVTRLKNPSAEDDLEVTQKLRPKIKICYDHLKSKVDKSLFLLCCTYPEGSNIQEEDLVRDGLGLGLFVNINSMEQVRNRVATSVDQLKKVSLLLDSTKQRCVRVHDLVRSTVLSSDSLASDKINNTFFVSYGANETIDGLGWNRETILDSRETRIASLSGMGDFSTHLLTKELKVLKIERNNPSIRITLPPCHLKNLRTLRMENCILRDVSSIGELRTLMILSLRHSSMVELPGSFRNLSNLWVLDLTGCRMEMNQNIIPSLNKLQEVYLLVKTQDYFTPGRDVSKLFSWQCKLTTLEIHLWGDIFASLQQLKLLDNLERFKISVGYDGPWDFDHHHQGNYLGISVKPDFSFVGGRIPKLLEKTQTLDIMMEVSSTAGTLEHIMDTELVRHYFAAPVLHLLTVDKSKLRARICKGQPPAGLFKELRCVKLNSCNNLSFLFPFPMAMDSNELEELDVLECYKLTRIFNGEAKKLEIRLPNLTRVNLVELPDFTGFSHVYIGMPLLLSIHLQNLPKLVAMFPRDSALQPSTSNSTATSQHLLDAMDGSFLQLQSLKVLRCDSVTRVFSLNTLQSLQNLEHLNVEYCQRLTLVFDVEAAAQASPVMLSCVKNMTLIGLPELEHIWRPRPKIQAFQNLTTLKVDSCEKLKYVFPAHIAEELVKLEELSVSTCDSMEQVICWNEQREAEARKVMIRVEKLILKNLPSLLSFSSVPPCTVEWPLLKRLEIRKLPQKNLLNEKVDSPCLEELIVEESEEFFFVIPIYMQQRWQKLRHLEVLNCKWAKQIFEYTRMTVQPLAFWSLTVLIVSGCNYIHSLFPYSVARALVKLEKLQVLCCRSVEEIVSEPTEEDGADDEKTSIFPCLVELECTDLRDLTSFCRAKQDIDWPHLRRVEFHGCTKMRTFSYGSVNTPLLVQNIQDDFDLNKHIRQEYNKGKDKENF